MRLALFQPDIPQNLGAAIRLGACLNVAVDVIRPTAFPLSAMELRRAAMDYADRADLALHDSWDRWRGSIGPARIVLLTTSGGESLMDARFRENDVLLLGRESAGVPAEVHDAADLRLCIPMAAGARSLNVVTAAAIALTEGLRQTDGWARLATPQTGVPHD